MSDYDNDDLELENDFDDENDDIGHDELLTDDELDTTKTVIESVIDSESKKDFNELLDMEWMRYAVNSKDFAEKIYFGRVLAMDLFKPMLEEIYQMHQMDIAPEIIKQKIGNHPLYENIISSINLDSLEDADKAVFKARFSSHAKNYIENYVAWKTNHRGYAIAEDYLQAVEKSGLIEQLRLTPKKVEPSRTIRDVEAWLRRLKADTVGRIPLSYRQLQHFLEGGWKRQCAYGIGGVTGEGKSITCCNLAADAVKQGFFALYISTEMEKWECDERIYRMITGTRNPDEAACAMTNYIKNHPEYQGFDVWAVSEKATSVPDIMRQVLKQKETGKPYDIVFIDYGDQLAVNGKFDAEYQAQAAKYSEMLVLAKETNTAVIVATQLKRECRGKGKIDIDGIADSFGKVKPLTALFNIESPDREKTPDWKEWKNLYLAKNRNAEEDVLLRFRFDRQTLQMIEPDDIVSFIDRENAKGMPDKFIVGRYLADYVPHILDGQPGSIEIPDDDYNKPKVKQNAESRD